MFELLGKIFLSSDVRELSEELAKANVKGAEVVGRGTIVVDGKVIASSDEFKQLQNQAKKMVRSRQHEHGAHP
jgi:fatty acid/phospholipid biosynthesis enzyme